MFVEKGHWKITFLNMNEVLYNHVIYQDLKYQTLGVSLILKNGTVCKSFHEGSFIDFFNEYLTSSVEENPFLIITGCGRLASLEKIIYSQNIKKHLNDNGLTIYLFEDLYIGTGTKVKNYLRGPSPNDTTYFDKFQFYIKGFESTEKHLSSIYSDELESISIFVNENNLTNVTVYTCDYNSKKYFQKIYQSFKIETKNLFLISSAKRFNVEFNKNIESIKYKFWCGNIKYKGFRHLVAAYVNSKNSLITLDQTSSIYGSLQNQLWFDFKNWKNTDPEVYQTLKQQLVKLRSTPILKYTDSEPLSNYGNYNFLNEHQYDVSFCSVVTESRFSQPTAIFSEKTLSAISKYRPFVVVAPPYTLEYLQSYGFKTFDKFWDESYDREENHEQRLLKIFKVIDFIDSMDISQLKDLYSNMIDIVNHNYTILKSIR
jgi:hypothetical protein